MEPQAKTLRDYQERLVFNVRRATGDVLVEQPTGSGKTVQIVALVAMHLGERFTHAVISAPQEQIERGFVQRDYDLVAFPQRHGVAVPSIRVPKRTILGARDSKVGSVKRVIQYLRQPGPLDHAFACTHAALNRLTADDLPADVTGKALFIDEAHHASADGLSRIVALWRERGGQLFFFTATPYRGDGRPVKLDGMRSYRRSLAEHMAEGFGPRHLESEIVALGRPGDTITAAQFTGEEAPPASYFNALVAAICRRWRDDGKPKAIVRVPPMQGGRSGELVRALTTALEAENARVLDATGIGTADKQRFLSGLQAEQRQTFATSTFDVMIGIQRVLEGTDWPLCGAVYCVGMPGSLNTVVQFLGRAMRLKGDDYPADQRDRARLVFFVPCGGGSALADLSIDHSRHALLTCCFLADHEVGQEWIVTQEVRRGIQAALGSCADNPAAADAENEADEPLEPEVRAEVELAITNAREQIVEKGGEPTLGEVLELTAKTRPDLPEAAIQRVAAEILAAQTTATGTAARKAIGQEIAKRLRIDPTVKKAMTEAFAVVLEEFRNATLRDSAVLASVGRQVHGVTGEQMQDFVERLRMAARPALTVDLILRWAQSHRDKTGDWPTNTSGVVLEAPTEKWVDIDVGLRQGLRGLTGGSSLVRLLEEKFGRRNQSNLPPLTVGKIIAWAQAHHQQTGAWPHARSGPVIDEPNETWRIIQQSLYYGVRGLPGGRTLTQLLQEHVGARLARNYHGLPPLTVEQVTAWIKAHHERTGEWPTRKSGKVLDTVDEKWTGIDNALIAGNRGLPGGSSIARIVSTEFGGRKPGSLPKLTEEQIIRWAESHKERTGTWPQQRSGAVHDAPGERWDSIDRALQNGGRGLSGGTTLRTVLGKSFGLPKAKNSTPLTVEQVLEWAQIHKQRTGEWPDAESGTIPDTDGETWARISSALSAGARSLPRGLSLKKLDPQATLELETILRWILAHRERVGDWPLIASGAIEEAPDKTWAAVDKLLRSGRCGLAGGSSLAKVLAEHFGVKDRRGRNPDANDSMLSIEQILAWVSSYKSRTGDWPKCNTGAIEDAPSESWAKIDYFLRSGGRGLNGGSSLATLLAEHHGVKNRRGHWSRKTDQLPEGEELSGTSDRRKDLLDTDPTTD